jgi:hypothetical protein
MSVDSATCLKEIRGVIESRPYYRSARVVLGLVRADGLAKPIGGFVTLSDKPMDETRSLDYDVLVLLETSLSVEAFSEWLAKVAGEGKASLAGFEIDAKGSFEPVSWPHERFMPSDYEYFPVEWGCDFYKFKFAAQTSLPGPLPSKPELPLYPDSQTAWGQWLRIQPTRIDLPGRLFLLFPNMDAKIGEVTLTSKSITISVTQGKSEFSSLKGKLFVQEPYSDSYRPSINADLAFPQGSAEVPIPFKPGFIYLTLTSNRGELIDVRKSYLTHPAGPGLRSELTSEELERIIDQGENETTEFKVELSKNHKEFAETMIAFSNLRGGLILVGIGDHGEVRGLQDTDLAKTEEQIQNFSREFCDPPVKFTLKKIELQGRSIIVVEIPEGSAKPYWLKNHGPIIRSGSTDRVMSRVESQQLFSTARGPYG